MSRSKSSSRQLLPLVLLLATACSKSDKGVSISGDVAGLDTIALRGDSIIALAERPFARDSIQLAAVTAGVPARDSVSAAPASDSTTRDSRAGSLASVDLNALGASEMSRRAVARGDSMARAAALKLVGSLSADGRSTGDTVRGVITLLGDTPPKRPALRAGESIITLSGMATRELPKLEGKDVMIRGIKITPRDVVVSDYVVRGVNGAPVLDGRLEQTDGVWHLRLTDGTGQKRISALPGPLRALEGTRVWMAMHDGAAPTTYGIIGSR